MSQLVPLTDLDSPNLNTPLDDRYQVVEILAARPWGRTYLAQDLHRPSQPDCVIHHYKTIPIVANYADLVRDLFVQEATLLERLGTHPRIPGLLAYFENDRGFYTVQELIPGTPLTAELQPNVCWQVEEVIAFLEDVLEPLVLAHRHGSMHSDLHPDNLLRRAADGRWMPINFGGMLQIQLTMMVAYGLVIPPAEAAQLGYQPLEQLQGLPCAASDVYTLGMLAIQALTGKQPAEFRVNPETVEILWQEHLPPSTSSLQAKLVAVLEGMVQWDITRRFATANDALLALQDLKQVAWMEVPVESPMIIHPDRGIMSSLPGDDQPEIDATGLVVREVESLTSTADAPKGAMVQRLVMQAIGSPSLQVSAGGIAVATTFAAVGWGLLNSVDWSEKTAKFWENMLQATTANTSNSPTAKDIVARWRQDWQNGAKNLQQAETAFSQGEWSEAKRLAIAMPDIPFWRDRGDSLAQKAIARAETEASQLLNTAYEYAQDRNFTAALAQLEQINPGTSIEQTTKAKTAEYRQKQAIKAWADLQQAYDRAIIRDFTNALTYLYQIPTDTAAYEIAQKKIVEYKQKEQFRARALIRAAADRAQNQNFLAAISSLETISTGTAIDQEADSQLETYTQQLNQQGDRWLEVANRQVRSGNVEGAIVALKNVPLGTPAYAQARDHLAELVALAQPPVSPKTPLHATLNPGEQLREIAGRRG